MPVPAARMTADRTRQPANRRVTLSPAIRCTTRMDAPPRRRRQARTEGGDPAYAAGACCCGGPPRPSWPPTRSRRDHHVRTRVRRGPETTPSTGVGFRFLASARTGVGMGLGALARFPAPGGRGDGSGGQRSTGPARRRCERSGASRCWARWLPRGNRPPTWGWNASGCACYQQATRYVVVARW